MTCFYFVPLLPIFNTRDITPETLKVSVISAGIILLPLLYFCLKSTPSRSLSSPLRLGFQEASQGAYPHKYRLFLLLKNIYGNKPLLIFFGALLAYGFGVGMWFSLIFLYVDSYLGLGEYFAQVFLISFIVGIFIAPVWYKLAIIFGKKTILSAAMMLLIASFIYATTLTPGVSGFWEVFILQLTNNLGASCIVMFSPAMLSEIIDYSTWKFRTESIATFYALFMFLGKFNIAVGGAMGLAIAGWYGFDATTKLQDPEGIFGVMLGMAWIPIIFILAALILILISPINTRRHGIVRQRLDARILNEN
jgi:Na+/melibiose symporter-like transporter